MASPSSFQNDHEITQEPKDHDLPNETDVQSTGTHPSRRWLPSDLLQKNKAPVSGLRSRLDAKWGRKLESRPLSPSSADGETFAEQRRRFVVPDDSLLPKIRSRSPSPRQRSNITFRSAPECVTSEQNQEGNDARIKQKTERFQYRLPRPEHQTTHQAAKRSEAPRHLESIRKSSLRQRSQVESSPGFVYDSQSDFARSPSRQRPGHFASTGNDFMDPPQLSPRTEYNPSAFGHTLQGSVTADGRMHRSSPSDRTSRTSQPCGQSHWSPELVGAAISDYDSVTFTVHRSSARSRSPPDLVGDTVADYVVEDVSPCSHIISDAQWLKFTYHSALSDE